MPLPPRFAPDVKLNGFEEARFAPGMFDNTSANYFTYVLGLTVDGTESIDSAGLKDFLEKYYTGLLRGVGQRMGMSVDGSQIDAEIESTQPAPKDGAECLGKVALVDTFSDGRKISVNVNCQLDSWRRDNDAEGGSQRPMPHCLCIYKRPTRGGAGKVLALRRFRTHAERRIAHDQQTGPSTQHLGKGRQQIGGSIRRPIGENKQRRRRPAHRWPHSS
ncbi:MAG: hypothetical protein NTW86_25290 [Candidatus Sumerlaeota bacterium]|nr:hypothetical protein [Candidatus Sumerlaeota bacterium]